LPSHRFAVPDWKVRDLIPLGGGTLRVVDVVWSDDEDAEVCALRRRPRVARRQSDRAASSAQNVALAPDSFSQAAMEARYELEQRRGG
jgi:hypothetical protein